MSKDEIKKILTNVKYDKQYYSEKCNAAKKIAKEIDNLTVAFSQQNVQNCVMIEMAEIIDALRAQCTEINAKASKILGNVRKVEEMIEQLDYPYKSVMYFRYIIGHDFGKIAQLMNYSDKRIYQLHAIAIELLSANIREI